MRQGCRSVSGGFDSALLPLLDPAFLLARVSALLVLIFSQQPVTKDATKPQEPPPAVVVRLGLRPRWYEVPMRTQKCAKIEFRTGSGSKTENKQIIYRVRAAARYVHCCLLQPTETLPTPFLQVARIGLFALLAVYPVNSSLKSVSLIFLKAQ